MHQTSLTPTYPCVSFFIIHFQQLENSRREGGIASKNNMDYDYRLLHPQWNLTTEEDSCVELAPVDFADFCYDFPVKSLINKSISETQKGNKLGEKSLYSQRKPKSISDNALVVMKIKWKTIM